MKVRMLQGLSGPTVNVRPGEEHECDAEEAKRLIAAGFAEPTKSQRKTATKETREKR